MIPILQLALIQLSAADEFCSFWAQACRSPYVLRAASGFVRGCWLASIPVSDARLSAPENVGASAPLHRRGLLSIARWMQ